MSQRKGLGRGLEAILGDQTPARAETNGPTGGVLTLPIDRVAPDPDQPRKHFGDEELAGLAASIKEQGVIQPILVQPARGGVHLIIAGERRWRACRKAGVAEVPVLVREVEPGGGAELALIENVQRVDLNPMEEADAYARLRDTFGRKPADIASSVGKSRSHVANMLRLVNLPESVRAKVVTGQLSMGHARALLSAADAEALAERVVAQDLSVRETERLASPEKREASDEATKGRKDGTGEAGRADLSRKARPASGAKDADTKALERDLEAALGLAVSIDHQGKAGGEIRIDYATLDQLDDICSRLMGTRI